MHLSAITKADFVLGWMYIDINSCCINFKIQHVRWVPTVKEYVPERLSYGMRHQPIADNATTIAHGTR